MKVLVIGSEGFLGRNVSQCLMDSPGNEVIGAARKPAPGSQYLDLSQPPTIAAALQAVQPDVVINCAGILSDGDTSQNVVFIKNLLEAIVASGRKPKQTVTFGSAAEYGEVGPEDIPVDEKTPLRATSGYGLSKLRETSFAGDFAKNHDLPLVIARVFNPLGPGMRDRFLVPRLLGQISKIKAGGQDALEISRLDARRDYMDVKDFAEAIKCIAEGESRQNVYNVGSGRSTTNGELIDLILDEVHLANRPEIVETSERPEPIVAHQADTSRIEHDYGWQAQIPLNATVKSIVNAAG